MSEAQATSKSSDMTVRELKQRIESNDGLVVLDVREPFEYAICNIGGTLIPLGVLPHRMHELDPKKEIAVICHHGVRSKRAVDMLRQAGFLNVHNVHGGIEAWADQIDPAMQRY